MKIVNFGVSANLEKRLTAELEGLDSAYTQDELTVETALLAKDAEVISVFVNSMVTNEIIDALPALKHIATRSTGYDHIDVEYADSREISVSSVPGYASISVAEHVFALLMTLSKKIYYAFDQIRESGDFNIEKLQGFDLNGKTLGVLGAGKIGKHVVQIACGFGMKVLMCDALQDEKFAREIGEKYVDLPELLSESDIITIHIPYSDETYHMINHGTINQMKDGVYIINTARGEIIDTSALLGALKSKKVAGAALDVLEGERELKIEAELVMEQKNISHVREIIQGHVLIDLPNVIITPHIASNTVEANNLRVHTAAENIKAFVSGNPQNIVQLKK